MRIVWRHRFIFQNQKEFVIDEQISIPIEVSRGQWLEDSISIVHGPTSKASEKPQVRPMKTKNPEEENIEVVFPKGVRPYATWMVICRTKRETPEVNKILVNDQNILKQSRVNSKKKRNKRELSQEIKDLTWITLSVTFLFLVIVFILNFTDYNSFIEKLMNNSFFLWAILFGGLISIVYSYFSIKICSPIKTNIIMGYLDERDPVSTSHWKSSFTKD